MGSLPSNRSMGILVRICPGNERCREDSLAEACGGLELSVIRALLTLILPAVLVKVGIVVFPVAERKTGSDDLGPKRIHLEGDSFGYLDLKSVSVTRTGLVPPPVFMPTFAKLREGKRGAGQLEETTDELFRESDEIHGPTKLLYEPLLVTSLGAAAPSGFATLDLVQEVLHRRIELLVLRKLLPVDGSPLRIGLVRPLDL